MGQWITALNKALLDIIESTSLLNAFSRVAVMEYKDYDVDEVVTFSGWLMPDDVKLLASAEKLRASGGGGAPEAFKTAVHRLLERELKSVDGHVHLFHLTDAPVHMPDGLDGEGKKEKAKLGDLFDFPTLLRKHEGLLSRITFVSLTTCTHEVFAFFAAVTGGDVHRYTDNVNATALRTAMSKVLNGWFGLTDSALANRYACRHDAAGLALLAEVKSDAALMRLGAALATAKPHAVAEPRQALASTVPLAVERLKRDEAFVDRTCTILRRVAENSPMAMTASPILGRLWRGFCNRRGDPRRDEILAIMDAKKNGLPAEDKVVFAAWLKESYNAAAEIKQQLREFISREGVRGVYRYHADEQFHPKAIAEAFLTLDAESLSMITRVLARLTLDESVRVDAAPPPPATVEATGPKATPNNDDDEDAAPLPIPLGCIPANLPPHLIFRLLFHTAAPGTVLSLRLSAILAVVCHLVGSVVAPVAASFLQAQRGRWINYKRRAEKDEMVPEVPENFALAFVRLMQKHERFLAQSDALAANDAASDHDAAAASNHVDPTAAVAAPVTARWTALTSAEADTMRFIVKCANAMRLERLECSVDVVDLSSMDGCFPDYGVVCNRCHVLRAFSLIAKDGQCGYCVGKNEPTSADARPPVDASACFQVMCHVCRAIYHRDRRIDIRGHSKCHFCQHKKTAVPHTVTCTGCRLSFVCESESFPKGNTKCAACVAGLATRCTAMKQHVVRTATVFPLEDFAPIFYAACGLAADAPVTCSFIKALTLFREVPPTPAGPYVPKAGKPPAEFRGQPISNLADLWTQTVAALRGVGRVELPTCSLCMEAKQPSQLAGACGRRGCQQRLCRDCGTTWYGELQPGRRFLPRHAMCAFCSRAPSDKALARWNPQLRLVARRRVGGRALEFDAAAVHGWCVRCRQVKVVAQDGGACCAPADAAAAARADPLPADVTNFTCAECTNALTPAAGGAAREARPVKSCPGCSVSIEKWGGCLHMTCTGCNVHFCWACLFSADNANAVYDHMQETHAGYYEGADEGVDDADD